MDNLPERVIATAESQIGSPYVFGAWGALCTPKERERRYRLRPTHSKILSQCQVLRSSNQKPNCDGCKWQGDRCFDCRGFTDWTLKQVGIDLYGEGATTQYSHKDNWLERGDIADMPECVCCVFVADGQSMSHTGLYVTGNHTIECSGEVKKRDLTTRWTHYAIPKGLYTAEEIESIRKEKKRLKRILKRGCQGSDVKELQTRLNYFGYDCGTADGIFGSKTERAVKVFQTDNGITPDGIVGPETWEKLDGGEQSEDVLYSVIVKNITGTQLADIQNKYPETEVIKG